MSGLKLAALYGFWPHQLGFCGSQRKKEKELLFNYLSGKKISEQKIRKILEGFKGAFSYYKLIAKSNNIEDPFDEKVVKAYWIGNQLLEKVSVNDLRKMIVKDFGKPGLLLKKIAEKKAKEIPETSKPHHSFHVFLLGSVTGKIVLEGQLLDFCRIGWGKVIKKLKSKNQRAKILVKYQPLIKENKKFRFEKPIKKEVFWEKTFLPKVKIGDWVSIHWNYAVQVLDSKDLANLKKYTQITINSLK